MKKYSLIILLFVLAACDPINKLYVKYGEAKPRLEQRQDQVIRLFFDRMGTLYPDKQIPDEGLVKSGGTLNQLYMNRPEVYREVLRIHGLSLASNTEQLQQRLIDDVVAKINMHAAGKKLVFLIHGYNNHPLKPDEENSFTVYRVLREKVSSHTGQPLQFVEVFWDGCSKMNGKQKPARLKLNSVKIWDNAQAASNNVAVELRRILYRVKNDDNIIITHSLGAGVATCALFNAIKFKDNEFMRGIIRKYRDAELYRTPLQKFRVGMLAPAIPGENTFMEFIDRTPAANSTDNYTFIVGLNTNDEVLNKFFGIPKWFGSTSLGCLQSELDRVKEIVNINGSQLIFHTDFSNIKNGEKQKDHSLLAYLENKQPLSEFLDLLFR